MLWVATGGQPARLACLSWLPACALLALLAFSVAHTQGVHALGPCSHTWHTSLHQPPIRSSCCPALPPPRCPHPVLQALRCGPWPTTCQMCGTSSATQAHPRQTTDVSSKQAPAGAAAQPTGRMASRVTGRHQVLLPLHGGSFLLAACSACSVAVPVPSMSPSMPLLSASGPLQYCCC